MFGIILVTAFTFMHVYVLWRAGAVPFLKRRVPRKVLIAAGVGLWAVFVLGRLYGHGGSGALANALELFGMDWMAVVFLSFVPLLVVDLVTGFGLLLSGHAPSLRGLALLAGGVLSLIALVQGMRPPVVRQYEVKLPGLPPEMDGTVLVAMSDTHVGAQLGTKWLEARAAQIQAERPDMVVLLGDILEGHGEPKGEALRALSSLSAPLGIWAVRGNHESHRRTAPIKIDVVRVLADEWAEVRPGLVLSGVKDLTARRRSGLGGSSVTEALAGRPAGAAILLSHTPWQAELAASLGAGLMLSGHTHGGQIWPFGCLVRRVYPLLGGRYEVDGMTVIVCRGTGTWGPRMRLWHPGEILSVTLRAA